jgi:hypothetical protein
LFHCQGCSTYIFVTVCDVIMWPHGLKVTINSRGMNEEIYSKKMKWK